jgi:hypothetical protein
MKVRYCNSCDLHYGHAGECVQLPGSPQHEPMNDRPKPNHDTPNPWGL